MRYFTWELKRGGLGTLRLVTGSGVAINELAHLERRVKKGEKGLEIGSEIGRDGREVKEVVGGCVH